MAGLSTRNYRRAVESVLDGYGIEKNSVSRQFVAASSNQLRVLCERRLEDLNLVVLMIVAVFRLLQLTVALQFHFLTLAGSYPWPFQRDLLSTEDHITRLLAEPLSPTLSAGNDVSRQYGFQVFKFPSTRLLRTLAQAAWYFAVRYCDFGKRSS